MNTDVRNLANLISVEALAGVNPTAILNRFPQFFSSVLEGCEKALAGLKPGTGGEFQQAGKELLSKLQGKSYSKLGDLKVYAPPGMRGTYLEYIEWLQPAITLAATVPGTVVAPYSRWVASLLSSPTRLSSMNVSMIPSVNQEYTSRNSNHALSALLDSHRQGKPEHVPYSQALARNNDWGKVFEAVGAMEATMSATKAHDFTEQVADLGHNVNRLVEMIKQEPETYRTSGTVLDKLTHATMDVALAIEYYSAAYYLLRQLETAVLDTKNKLAAATA